MADPGTASAPMTVEERARDVVTQLCGPRAAENWVNRDAVINHIHAAEQEARAAVNAEWEDRHRKVLDAGAAAIRAAEQEAAVQARSEADVKWANELSRLLADGEQEAEQRGAERERKAIKHELRGWADNFRATSPKGKEENRMAEALEGACSVIDARGKQQEPASA